MALLSATNKDRNINEMNFNKVKIPNWPEANQLAIYKHGRGVESGLPRTNPQNKSENKSS